MYMRGVVVTLAVDCCPANQIEVDLQGRSNKGQLLCRDLQRSVQVTPQALDCRTVPGQKIDLRLPTAHIAFHGGRCRPLPLEDQIAKVRVENLAVFKGIAEQG